MTLTIRHVATNYCAQTWPLVEHFIADAHAFGGDDYSMDQIQMYVNLGSWVLLVAVDENNVIHGAGTVSFMNYPTNRIAFLTAVGGKLIVDWDTLNQLKVILKGMGATRIQGAVRDSVARLLRRYSFEKRYTIVQTDI